MNLQQLLGIVRAVMGALAAIAIAHGIAAGTWDAFVGFAVALVTLIWGIYQHDATSDQALSLVRAFIAALGGYAIQRGWLSSDQVTQWGGIAVLVVPMVWTYIVHADPSISSGGGSGGSGASVSTGPKASFGRFGSALMFAGVFSRRPARLFAPLGLCAALALSACAATLAPDGNVAIGAIEVNFGSAKSNAAVVAVIQKIDSGAAAAQTDVAAFCTVDKLFITAFQSAGLTGKLSSNTLNGLQQAASLPACTLGLTGTIADAGTLQASITAAIVDIRKAL